MKDTTKNSLSTFERIPLNVDLAPLHEAISEAVSLLGPQVGLVFLNQISNRFLKEGPDLFRCEDVVADPTDDRALIRVKASDGFASALAALRAGDRNGFWRHLGIPGSCL